MTTTSGRKTVTQHAIEAMRSIPGCYRFDVDVSSSERRSNRNVRATIRLEVNARVVDDEVVPHAVKD